MSSINIEITEAKLKELVLCWLRETVVDCNINPEDVIIEVKSKQNYRSEWEVAAFRARVTKRI